MSVLFDIDIGFLNFFNLLVNSYLYYGEEPEVHQLYLEPSLDATSIQALVRFVQEFLFKVSVTHTTNATTFYILYIINTATLIESLFLGGRKQV